MGRPWKLAFVNEKKPKIGLSWPTKLWVVVCRDTRGCDFRSVVTHEVVTSLGLVSHEVVTSGLTWHTRLWAVVCRDTRSCDFRSDVSHKVVTSGLVSHEGVTSGLTWHTRLWVVVCRDTRSCDFRSRVTRGCDLKVWRVTRGCELWSVVTHEGVTSALSCHGSLRIALSPIISLGKCARCLGAWLQLRNPFRANLREAVVSHNVYVFLFNVLFVNTCNIYVQMVY